MFYKTCVNVLGLTSRSLRRCKEFRRSTSSASYVHCPGSEPLRYLTVGDALQDAANKWPSRVAVRSIHQDDTITYEQLVERANALGCALREAGLEKGDRLGIWAHNCSEWLVAMAAATTVGIIPVAINPVYETPELSFCIRKVGLKGLMIGEEIAGRNYYNILREVIPELRSSKPGNINSETFCDLKIVIACGKQSLPGTYSFDRLVAEFTRKARNDASKYNTEVKPEDGCIIHLTSGTTGEPKAALDSHFGVVNNTYLLGKRNTLHEGHHKICVQVPLFHGFGTMISAMAAMRHGSTLVIPAAYYSARANAHSLITEKCTVVHGTPTMFVDLINTVKQSGGRPSARVALTGGAPCSPQLFRDIQQHLGVESVKSLYGMTETTAAVFQSMPGETEELITNTVGRIHDHLEVKVVDENDKAVPFGCPGELLVRGYSIMMGYWDEPWKTKQTIDVHGWLRTGDQFTLEADGYGSVVGRLKDIIIRGGENIAPKEIEDVINSHPKILESQIVGVSDDRLGEEICAVLRLQDDATNITLDEIQRYCSGKLAKYKAPRILRVVQVFPKTASGKIQKYKLKEMVESGKL